MEPQRKPPPPTPVAAEASRLLETVRRGKSGRVINPTPLVDPNLALEYGSLRFWTATYGFLYRKVLELPNDGRTAPEDALAGARDSRSLFVGRDDLADGEPDPVRGALMLYSLTPPGAQLISYRGKLYRPHSAKLKAIHVTSARLVSRDIARLLPAGTTLTIDGGKTFVAPIQLLDALTSSAPTVITVPTTTPPAPQSLSYNKPSLPAPPPAPRSAWDFAVSRSRADTSTSPPIELASTIPSGGASITADNDDEMLSPDKFANINFAEWFAEEERKEPPPGLPPLTSEPLWLTQGNIATPPPPAAAGFEPFWFAQGLAAVAPQPRFPPRGPTARDSVPPLFTPSYIPASWGAAPIQHSPLHWESTPPPPVPLQPTNLLGLPPPPPAAKPLAPGGPPSPYFTSTFTSPTPPQPYLHGHSGHGGAPPPGLFDQSAL